METRQRPSRRDWVAAIVAGTLIGLVIFGVGSRIGMRVIALDSGQLGSFSFEGSLTVVLLGGCAGAAAGAIFALSRALFPSRAWARHLLFWGATSALMLRGLNPVTWFRVAVFMPLLAVHGVLLYAYWRRWRKH